MSVMIGSPLFLSSAGYQISRSVRLRSSASAYLNRTNSSSVTNNKIFTYSLWVKRGSLGVTSSLLAGDNSTAIHYFGYGNSSVAADTLEFYDGQTATWKIQTNAVYRDPSAYYHVILSVDTTQATAANRVRIYVNGVECSYATATYPAQNTVPNINVASMPLYIGRRSNVSQWYFDGYMTEINFIDGQALTPSSFGETNPVTGVWQPKKYAGTYGTNGFYLNFSDNSAATATTIGKDYSGNGNNWTPNNISVTAGVTYDSMLDVPTQWDDGGNGRGNYCTGNPLIMYNGGGGAAIIPKNGNLDLIGGAGWAMVGSTIAVSTGKWYWEATFFKPGSGDGVLGIHKSNTSLFQIVGYSGDPNGYGYAANGNKLNNSTGVAYGASYTNGDVIGVALDLDAGTLTFYKNNTSQGVAFSSLSGEFFPAFSSETAYFQANFGQRPFAYTPPTGFKALNTLNLPTPTISNGASYMAATTYTGTGSALSVSNAVNGVSFQPDFVWTKPRSTAVGHTLFDSLRGVTKYLQSNTTGAEGTAATSLTAFNSNGFTVNSDTSTGANGVTYVGWQWKEGATQGFDIVTFTNTASSASFNHNLGVTPAMIILKGRGPTAANWSVFHRSLANMTSAYLNLNNTNAVGTLGTAVPAPTSTTFGSSSAAIPASESSVAYLFAAVAGYSAFGSYTGNGSTDGTFVFTGFRPKFVMFKRTDSTSEWGMWDTSRNPSNAATSRLSANSSAAELNQAATTIDILSNGFKFRTADTDINASGGTYIYMAFAENPFKNALAR